MVASGLTLTLAAQEVKPLKYLEASELTLVGKLMPTPNPYWRVDTAAYKGFTPTENNQVRCGAGMAVAFRTDSPIISVQISRRPSYVGNSTGMISSAGFDLYIKKGKTWVWAGNTGFPNGDDGPRVVLANADGSMHECLLYLPIHTELLGCRIGVEQGSVLEALPNPFRHRIVLFGSSYTHGSSTSRPAMSYPKQLERMTGLQMISLGCGGNGKLQSYFADVLRDVEADAFLFDQFSNPSAQMIEERLFPFIEKIQAAHPGVPIIFQQTIRRETRNFNTAADARESAKAALADSLMAVAVKKYPDVYFIRAEASHPSHEYFVDGTHPDNYGYWLWARSICKPLVRILKRYGID